MNYRHLLRRPSRARISMSPSAAFPVMARRLLSMSWMRCVIRPVVENLPNGIRIDAMPQQGTRKARSFAIRSRQVSQATVQDLRLPRASSQSVEDTCVLRPHRLPAVQGRICRRMEGRLRRTGCCCQSDEDIFKQRLAEDHRGRPRIEFPFSVL